jgi:phosphatidylethanolamine N-methyltransferase
VFTVPQTHDMVSQLLSPSQPKNWGDLVVVAILGFHILGLYVLPVSLRVPVFAVVYLTWRAAYNAGIGYLLHVQSNHNRLVVWAKKLKVFGAPKDCANPRPWLYYFIKTELETKIPHNYAFDDAPIEYNTWLVFRRIVDLILMCDFVSYCLFAVACGGRPDNESVAMTFFRWLVGWGLVGFNLWVKLDAHRVVKDYAWYWGDFFYLIDQELTFDGVFEMAPHPMYSVGYAGYYGISLMAASYKVLFISIVAHAAQFAFLVWVENPHIEKIYNAPAPRKRPQDETQQQSTEELTSGHVNGAPALATTTQPSPVHKLVGISNIDLCRVTDTSVLLLSFYLVVLTAATPTTTLYQTLFVLHAVAWRLWYAIGIGYILNRQSAKKNWTRHFVKFGESTEEAWRQWKGMCHLSMTMTYASFIAATWKLYVPPSDWSQDMALLKHILGVALVSLHTWTAISIYQSLGEFGWFYGDFFFDHASKLTYGGIYRFLNNPERVIGLAGLWAAVLFTGSSAIFMTSLLSHISSLLFIQFVERPHMQKLYGESLRRESGLVKSLKRSLPPSFRQWQGSMDKMLGETVDFVEEFIDAARPKIAAGVSLFVKDTTSLFKQPARISITRLEPDLAGYDPKDYSVEVQGASPSGGPQSFPFGTPVRVKWTAPLNHSRRDWIGLYRVADNPSREVTRVSSAGRWVPTDPEQYDSLIADKSVVSSNERVSGATRKDGEVQDYLSGVVEFRGDRLWWTAGVFEVRYHHNGKHNVMAISRPFEIRIDRFDEYDVEVDSNGLIRTAMQDALLPVVRDCFDRDPDIAPNTVMETYGSVVERDGKYAKRVVYAVTHM